MSDRLHTPLADLLDSYLAGTSSEEQRQEMERYLAGRPEVARRLVFMRRLLGGAMPAAPAVGPVLEQLARRIREMEPSSGRHTTDVPPHSAAASQSRSRSRGIWSALGGLVGVILLGLLGWQNTRFSGGRPVSLEMSTYTTPKGQRASLTLQDGTIVFLNVGSRLEVPATYTAENRTVRLTGEAFFTVMHQGGSPFTVIAGPSITRVLGTRFAVRYYSTDTAAAISVRDGKVAVHSAVLTANEQITVSSSGLSRISPSTPNRFSFAQGVLTLQSVPLSSAIVELSRWYNADIRLGDGRLSNQRITGEFTEGAISDLVEILEGSFNVRVEREGKTVTLHTR